MKNTIIFYETVSGNCPLEDFLETLSEKHHAKVIRDLELLEEFGKDLGGGYISNIKGKLWELRICFAGDISRIMYFIHKGSIFVMLHGFIKKTQKTPNREIDIALSRMKDYLERNN